MHQKDYAYQQQDGYAVGTQTEGMLPQVVGSHLWQPTIEP